MGAGFVGLELFVEAMKVSLQRKLTVEALETFRKRETGPAKADKALEFLTLYGKQCFGVRARVRASVRRLFLHLRWLGLRVGVITGDLAKLGLCLPRSRALLDLLATAEQD